MKGTRNDGLASLAHNFAPSVQFWALSHSQTRSRLTAAALRRQGKETRHCIWLCTRDRVL